MSPTDPAAASTSTLRRLASVAISAAGLAVALMLLATPVARADQSVRELTDTFKEQIVANDTLGASKTVATLLEMNTASSVEAVGKFGFLGDDPELERYIIKAMRKLPENSPGIPKLAKLLRKDDDYRIRVALILALKNRNESDAWSAVVQQLFATNFYAAQLEAITAVREREDVNAIEHLIDAYTIEENSGRVGHVVHGEMQKALEFLTGQDEFYRAREWKAFWKRDKDKILPPSLRKGNQKKERSRTRVVEEAPLFFGAEVATKRTIFIIDCSQSMLKEDDPPEATEDVPGASSDPPPATTSRQRLERVKAELIRTIRKLPEDTFFNIIAFNHEIRVFQENRLLRATNANKARAIQFVGTDCTANGLTRTDLALEVAFKVQNVDTLFLLSDGAPRREGKGDAGKIPVDQILEWVRTENRFRRIRIHAITFKQCGDNLKRFMKLIANRNKGEYREIP